MLPNLASRVSGRSVLSSVLIGRQERLWCETTRGRGTEEFIRSERREGLEMTPRDRLKGSDRVMAVTRLTSEAVHRLEWGSFE